MTYAKELKEIADKRREEQKKKIAGYALACYEEVKPSLRERAMNGFFYGTIKVAPKYQYDGVFEALHSILESEGFTIRVDTGTQLTVFWG